jgi:hypothetical protein
MSHVTAQVSLRPIRFAFLVRPDEKKGTLEIFRINTCLWGGRFNPIIPTSSTRQATLMAARYPRCASLRAGT